VISFTGCFRGRGQGGRGIRRAVDHPEWGFVPVAAVAPQRGVGQTVAKRSSV